MRNAVQLCLAANNILLLRKETVLFSFLRSLLRENGRSLRFPRIFIKKQTRWSNDKTITELGYRNIVTCQSLADQLFVSAFGFGK